ncbi:class C sortase [Robinsoniella peoriensis]|uniref:class C sortase n=1 Tax=Robinsoniella peoriensis TaxID=180332 RepID=UPI00085C47A4|nr:class C sortase [Robinsoniella peoriensis]
MILKKKIILIMAVISLAAGMGLLLYPYISQQVYDREVRKVLEAFDQKTDKMKREMKAEVSDTSVPKPFFDELYEKILAYNRNLFLSGQKDLVDPFSYEQIGFSLKEWGFDEDMIGSLKISKMDIELPVYLGATNENMAKGAAHLTQTSLPVGGINSNAVIAAHRGYSRAAMFRDIEKLEPGDEVIIKNFRETLTYRVAEIKILKPTDIQEILIQEGRDLITLLTCHPYGFNLQRYAVLCERVPSKAEKH